MLKSCHQTPLNYGVNQKTISLIIPAAYNKSFEVWRFSGFSDFLTILNFWVFFMDFLDFFGFFFIFYFFWDLLDFQEYFGFLNFLIFFRFFWILFLFFWFLSKLLRLLLNVSTVTTGHQKSPKMGQNSIKNFFFAQRAKKASANGRLPPQELEQARVAGRIFQCNIFDLFDICDILDIFHMCDVFDVFYMPNKLVYIFDFIIQHGEDQEMRRVPPKIEILSVRSICLCRILSFSNHYLHLILGFKYPSQTMVSM